MRIDDIFENEIMEKLRSITVENGYPETVCVVDGSIKYYVEDLLNDDLPEFFFPCVSARLGADSSPRISSDGKNAKVSRTVVIYGVVDSLVRAEINRKLSSLVWSVRSALAVNNFDVIGRNVFSIELLDATFDDPDPKDRYVSFEMLVTVTYSEKLGV